MCSGCACVWGKTGTKNQESITSGLDSFNVALFMLIAFSFVPAAWISFVVREKETKCKHQQVRTARSVYGGDRAGVLLLVPGALPTPPPACPLRRKFLESSVRIWRDPWPVVRSIVTPVEGLPFTRPL